MSTVTPSATNTTSTTTTTTTSAAIATDGKRKIKIKKRSRPSGDDEEDQGGETPGSKSKRQKVTGGGVQLQLEMFRYNKTTEYYSVDLVSCNKGEDDKLVKSGDYGSYAKAYAFIVGNDIPFFATLQKLGEYIQNSVFAGSLYYSDIDVDLIKINTININLDDEISRPIAERKYNIVIDFNEGENNHYYTSPMCKLSDLAFTTSSGDDQLF